MCLQPVYEGRADVSRWRLQIIALAIYLPLIVIISPAVHALDFASSDAAIAFQNENYNAALQGFTEMLDAPETSVSDKPLIKRYIALSLDRLGQYEQAINAFNEALALQPNSSATHYHLGVAHYKSRSIEAAEKHFNDAVNIAPGSEYEKLSSLYLDAIAEQRLNLQQPGAPKKWGFYVSAALNNDDNIPLAYTDSPLASQDIEGTRFSVFGVADYYLMRQEDWTAKLGASIYSATFDDSEFSDFKVTEYRVLGLLQRAAVVGNKPVTTKIGADIWTVKFGGEPYSDSYSVKLGSEVRFSPNTRTDFLYRFESNSFDNDGFDAAISSRDDEIHRLGVKQHFYFGKKSSQLTLHAATASYDADGLNFNKDRDIYGISTKISLPHKFRFEAGYTRIDDDYPDFRGPVRRETNRSEYYLGFSKWLSSKWLGRIRYRNRDEQSSIDILEYDREQIGVSFGYVF